MFSHERLVYRYEDLKIPSNPVVELIEGGRFIVLREHFTFTLFGVTITLDPGFKSDGSSVPWFFSRLVPRLYGTATAALIHDAIYRHRMHYGFSREQADEAYRITLVRHGFSLARAKIAWSGLHVGGRFNWRKLCR